MASFFRQTVKEHSTPIISILVTIAYGPLVHFIVPKMVKTNLENGRELIFVCV
jgi:predicted SnoaL-like aldol condensation-catalyzing enzyme